MSRNLELTMTPRAEVVVLNGCLTRAWDAVTRDRVPCKVFVALVAVKRDRDAAAFDRDLIELLPAARPTDLRDVLK